LGLSSRSDAEAVREQLNAALPDGIEVIDVTERAGGLPTSQLTASEWLVTLPGLPPQAVAPAVEAFLALEHAPVERLTSKGERPRACPFPARQPYSRPRRSNTTSFRAARAALVVRAGRLCPQSAQRRRARKPDWRLPECSTAS